MSSKEDSSDQEEDWDKRVVWAEEQGLKNIQEKFTTADNMNKEAQTTLTYVLTGMGGTFAYLLQSLEKPLTVLVLSDAMLCAYFCILGVYLVWRTQFLGSYPSPFQSPNNLMSHHPEWPTVRLRRAELKGLEIRLDESIKWIEKKSRAINIVRFLLVVSPIVFVALAWVCKHFDLVKAGG